MDREMTKHNSSSHKRLSVNYLVSLMLLWARHANRFSKKLRLKPKKRAHTDVETPKSGAKGQRPRWNLTSSSLGSNRPKELLTALSNKAMTMVGRKNTGEEFKPEKKAATEEEEHGVWQKEILLGGKCEPLNYSGVIYYDCSGRQLKDGPPRSPRGSPLPRSPRDTPLPRSPIGTPLPRSPRGAPLPLSLTHF